jgi:hypothetical protein
MHVEGHHDRPGSYCCFFWPRLPKRLGRPRKNSARSRLILGMPFLICLGIRGCRRFGIVPDHPTQLPGPCLAWLAAFRHGRGSSLTSASAPVQTVCGRAGS